MTRVVCRECGAAYPIASDFELDGECRECGETTLVEEDAYDTEPMVLVCVDCRREVDGDPAGGGAGEEDGDFAARRSVEDPCPLCGGELTPREDAPPPRALPESALARSAARAVRQRHGAETPVDVEALIAAEGLRIEREAGIAEPYLSEGVIHAPLHQHRGAERFAFGHELGHHELGHRVPESRIELEANAFAAELLMPRAELRALVEAGYTLPRLVATFDVSREALLRSLTTARLVDRVALT